jgi:zinc protease
MIEQTYVDGIPTLLASATGPARGGITFRVGHADETLARSGITHLIEHLALFQLGVTDYHYNGATGSTVTHFFSQGSPTDIAQYLTSVCTALNDLPWHRLEMEKEILRTEASGRGRSPAEPLLLYRYGARSYGVRSYPEFGLAALTADDLRAWIARYFTRENAVLWFSGTTPPPNLRLALPSGTRLPLPAATSALKKTPAWFDGPPRAVAFHTLVPRSAAAQVYAGVLEREMFRWLRQEGGYSYTVATDYDPVDREQAAIIAFADAHPEKQEAALGAFIDVLAKLRWGSIERSDVDGTVAKATEALRDPDVEANRLPAAAFNVLIGTPVESAADRLREIEAVTPDQVRAIAEGAAAGGLLMVPEDLRADWAGYTSAPTRSDTVVTGSRYPMRGSSDCALVFAQDGVSFTAPQGAATVHFARCAAMLAWPDGGRVLIGDDGISCRVEPTLYPIDAAALAWLDGALPAETIVRMPARDPESIPQPAQANPSTMPGLAPGRDANVADWSKPISGSASVNTQGAALGTVPTAPGTTGAYPAPSVTPPQPGPKHKELTIIGLVVIGLVAVICFGVSALGTAGAVLDPSADASSLAGGLAIFWVGTAVLVTICVVLARRLRR